MVYDGSDLSGKVIGNDTGDFNDQEFHSNGTDMFINFISDANSDSVATGFNASFSIGIYILLYISYLIINKILKKINVISFMFRGRRYCGSLRRSEAVCL